MVKVLKPFMNGDKIVHPGDSVTVDAGRHAELARNGLVEPPKGANAHKAVKPEAGVVKTAARPSRRKKIVGE